MDNNKELKLDLKLINFYEKSLDEVLAGWKKTLLEWKRSIYTFYILSLIMYVVGLLFGLLIGGALK